MAGEDVVSPGCPLVSRPKPNFHCRGPRGGALATETDWLLFCLELTKILTWHIIFLLILAQTYQAPKFELSVSFLVGKQQFSCVNSQSGA